MTVTRMPAIARSNVDGVPVLWSEAPGPLTAVLIFRTGRADERAADGGITHLVEHLAMTPLGQPRYDHNAFVESNRTVFFASGTEAEVVAFFDIVTRSLSGLPLDRLDLEREVLRRERDGQGGSVIDAHRHYRYGLWGHGLIAEPEFGLGTVDAERVAAWVRAGFGTGNAVMWLTGPPPADLRLHLGDGGYRPPPPPEPIPDISWPSHLSSDIPGFALGFQQARQTGAGTFASILQTRLRQRLRLDRGLVYDVVSAYEPLDAGWAASIIGTDCAPDQVGVVSDIALAELDALTRGEATDSELADELADLERGLNDPTAVGGLLDHMATDELLGMPQRSPEERHEEQRLTSAAHVATRAAEARALALLMADIPTPPPGFQAYPASSTAVVSGREVKPFLSVLGFGPKHRLIIGPSGVSIRAKDGSIATVRYEDCVMLEQPTEDEAILWGRDGARVVIPADFWRGGEDVIEEVKRSLPADLVVREPLSADLDD